MSQLLLAGGGVSAIAISYALFRYGKKANKGGEVFALGMITLLILGVALIVKALTG